MQAGVVRQHTGAADVIAGIFRLENVDGDPTGFTIFYPTALDLVDLAATLGMTQSAVSHQLSLMREMRVVKSRKEGRMVYYTLDDEHIRDLFQRGLEHIEHR